MGVKIDINSIQRDMFIEHNGQPHRVLDYEHVKPGKGIEITYKSSDSIELADFEQVFAEYSYNDGDYYYFVSKTTYEMLAVPTKNIENEIKFLKEGMEVVVFIYKGQPIGIELPRHVELKVVETEPAFKGDTAAGGSKPAKLETGAVVQVPFFVGEGDIIKVDTRTGAYIERVK
jgi:elongation factor P